MGDEHKRGEPRSGSILIVALLAALALTHFYSFLLFHTLAELFTIAVAWSVFFLAWNARRFLDNHYLLLIGIASLFIGVIDVFHTLAYKGMGVFPGNDANVPTQLWIAGRYLQSATFLAAPFFVRRKLNPGRAVALYAAISALLLGSIAGGWFPDCFVEGAGLTPFKIVSEYLVALVFLASAALLFRERRRFDPPVLRQLAGAVLLATAAAMSFTLYVDVYGISNATGHLLRFASFCLIYRAIIVTGLVRPFDLLFRELAHNEAALRRSDERYRAFLANSSEGISRVEVDPPLALALPEEELFRQLLDRARVAECNEAYARMHGASGAAEIVGTRLGDILARSSPGGGGLLRAFVRTGCRRAEGEIHEAGAGANPRWLAGSLTGVVENGLLVRIWGVERDITERKRAVMERERLIGELQQALAEVNTLSGLLPICAQCKKIRDDKGYWTRVESYFQEHSGLSFSHGFCPDCFKVLYPEFEYPEDEPC